MARRGGFWVAPVLAGILGAGLVVWHEAARDGAVLAAAPDSPSACSGATYSQGAWSSQPKGNNPGTLLDAYFAQTKNAKVVIGCTSANGRTLTFTNVAAIRAFLPATASPGILAASATNPKTSAAGVFAGHVLALQLNVQLSDARVLPAGLSNYVVTGGPAAGLTVGAVLADANKALGGCGFPSYAPTASQFATVIQGLIDICYLPKSNGTPVVDAGRDQTITLPAGAILSGTATDDGFPNPPAALTYLWSQASGPNTAAIATPTQLTTSVSFPIAGAYVFRLTASDSALSASDTLQVTVNPAPEVDPGGGSGGGSGGGDEEPPPPNPDAPTIRALVSPPPNARGWNNTDVAVSFACTSAVSCPAPIVLTTEGAGQVVERTVSNSAGNTATARVTLNVDKTPPAMDVTFPTRALPGQAVVFPVAAQDLSGVASSTLIVRRALADSRTAAPFALTWNVPAEEPVGLDETVEVVVEDVAGNTVARRQAVPIQRADTTAPVVTVTAPPTAAPGASVAVVVAASDDRALGTVRLSQTTPDGTVFLENRTVAPFGFQVVATIPAALPAGAVVSFAAIGTDAEGNVGGAEARTIVATSVETTALEIHVNPPVTPTFQTSAAVTGTIGRGTTTAPPPAPLIVAGVMPASARQGQTADIVISGINAQFTSLSQIALGTGVSVTAIFAADASHLNARISVAADATVGPRLLNVSTGSQQAFLDSAFSILPGLGSAGGRVLNGSSQPVAGAQVCVAQTTACTATGGDGRFTLSNVTADSSRIAVTAGGFEPASIPIAVPVGGTSNVGDVVLAAANYPPPPPLPNSPPVTPALASVLGRGAASIAPGGDAGQLRRLVRDAIVAVGGGELGVLDENGQQLNPRMTGAGYASFTNAAVTDIVTGLTGGDTTSLAALFKTFVGSLRFPDGVPLPTLAQLIAAFQDSVDRAWADPTRTDAPLAMLLFNQGRVTSTTAPRVNFDTRFNALQQHLIAASFAVTLNRSFSLPSNTARRLVEDDARLARVDADEGRRGFMSRLLAWLPLPAPPAAASARWSRSAGTRRLSSATAVTAPIVTGLNGDRRRQSIDRLRGLAPRLQDSTNPYAVLSPAASPLSVMWGEVLQQSIPNGGWSVAKNGGSLCNDFLVTLGTATGEAVYGSSPEGQALAKDPSAKFLPAPGCKDAAQLIEILASSQSETLRNASNAFSSFLLSEGATVASAQRIQETFTSQSTMAAWTAAKQEAAQIGQVTKLLKVAGSVSETYLTKLQGEMAGFILNFEAQLVLQSLAPRAPFVVKATQVVDPTAKPAGPSRIVNIEFDRSPNDRGVYDTDDITWIYELYRTHGGVTYLVTKKKFPRSTENRLAFKDEVPEDGTYVYTVRGVRWVGQPRMQAQADPAYVAKTLGFLGGFLNTTLTIGGRAYLGLGVVQAVGDPLAEIYKGVNVQTSPFSNRQFINVSTTQASPRPPATLAVQLYGGDAFLSIPSLGKIFNVSGGTIAPFADANFLTPGQVGLAVDSRGDVYTDNAASDGQFGGRLFRFKRANAARAFIGSTNYYSMLLQYANPVSVVSMLTATTLGGEALFIADALNQRITRLTLPFLFAPGVTPDHNVSQPYATSPLFAMGPATTMAMRNDGTLAVTQGNNVLLVEPNGSRVTRLFSDEHAAPSPFSSVSGVAFDNYGNMYVSDAILGTVTMIPRFQQTALNGLAGVSAIERKKLTMIRGSRRPTEVTLSGAHDGLVFFDAERASVSVRFGMSGQVTDGVSPIAGAEVYVPELKQLTVTDGDGIFVLPDLVTAGKSPMIEFLVRSEGRSQSFNTILDPFKHNVVDVVFNPTLPPPPNDIRPPILPPTEPHPPVIQPSGKETVSVKVTIDRPHGNEDPGDPDGLCPRGLFLAPALGIGSLAASTIVTGAITSNGFVSAILIVNGVATSVPLVGQQFSVSAGLLPGANAMTIALPAGVLKPLGCADLSLDDAEPVNISGTHTVFHDPDPDELARYRSAMGFDVAVRGLVLENGEPLAGLSFVVPGTDYEGTTDGDGVFQANLPTALLGTAASAADGLAGQFYARVAGIVALLRAEQRAPAIDAISAFLLQAGAVGDSPPPAAASAGDLLSRLVLAQVTARRLLLQLQSTIGIPDPNDIDALEAIGTQLAATTSGGDIVVRGKEYPELVISVKVQ